MPRVSIVLPVYNGARYLCESVESIRRQTFQDWELIIVNDCSTDETPQIIEEYAKHDDRVRVIHNPTNQKLPRSLNIGFAAAKGEYLTWTSDDNIYEPTAIAEMVSFLDKNSDMPMVVAGCRTINEHGEIIGVLKPYNEYTMLIEDTVGACFLYRSTVRKEIGDYNPAKFLVEDFDYWIRILERYGHIGRIDTYQYLYRVHLNSLTGTRIKEVCYRRSLLHQEHFEKILRIYDNDNSKLTQVYYDLMEGGAEFDGLREQIRERIPELKNEVFDFDAQAAYIIFGAGEYGLKAKKNEKLDYVAFIDNNPSKQNGIVDDLPVMSLDAYCQNERRDKILVAIGFDHIYEVIHQLNAANIKTFSTCYGLSRFG